MEMKVGFAALFIDITRRGSIIEESSIHSAEMTAINIALKEIHKKIRKSPNTKPELQAQEKISHCAKYLHIWEVKETKKQTATK